MKKKRDKNKIREKLKKEFVERKRLWFPNFELSEGKKNSHHWDVAAENILELGGNVYDYVNIVFGRCNPARNADVFVLSQDKTKELYSVFIAEKPETAKKNIEWMERLYEVKVKKQFSKPRILMDITLPFNAAFRYVKALQESLLEVAYQFEDAAVEFFSEYPEYYDYYKDQLPEDIKCQL